MPDYMPRSDADFDTWAAHFKAAIKPWWEGEGLSPDLYDALNEALGAWQVAYPEHIAAQAAAEAATQSKRAARAALESAARAMTRVAQAYPTMTDALRADFGVTVPDAKATHAPAPTTAPIASVETPARLTHTLRLSDSSTPTRSKKPAGTRGAEVWMKLIEPGSGQAAVGSGQSQSAAPGSSPLPTAHSPLPASLGDPSTFHFITLATRPSITTTYPPADGGKTAVYMLRWVSTRGQAGPWSEACTATVAA